MRQTGHLAAIARRHPMAWAQLARFHASRGAAGLPDWPEWVYVPIAGAYAVVSRGLDNRLDPAEVIDIGRVAALGAWRQSQGIYRFDATLLSALLATPVVGALPCDLLHRLPEWCVYVETPGVVLEGDPLHGFYAHLEVDQGDGREELRLVLDLERDGLIPYPLHLGGDLAEAIDRMVFEAKYQRRRWSTRSSPLPDGVGERGQHVLAPLVSLLLYLCSEAAEIRDARGTERRPAGHQAPTRTPNAPTRWETGSRLGAARRAAQSREPSPRGEGSHASPRAHVRRAHWHAFLRGPKSGTQERVLRWLHPILVAGTPDDLTPTIHPVDDGDTDGS